MTEIEYNPAAKPMNKHQFRQLSLFNMKPEDAGRFPRGYTPDRLHDVADAVHGRVRVHPMSPDEQEDHPFVVTQTQSTGRRTTAAEHKITDTIARSKTPVHDLLGGMTVHRTRQGHDDSEPMTVDPLEFHVRGRYGNAAGALAQDLNRGRVATPLHLMPGSKFDPDMVLMHELGHRRSVVWGTPHSDLGSNENRVGGMYKPETIGQEEAFADRNATERMVRRKGDNRPTAPGVYPGGAYFSDDDNIGRFDKAYKEAFPERGQIHARQALAQAKGKGMTADEARAQKDWVSPPDTVMAWHKAAAFVRQPEMLFQTGTNDKGWGEGGYSMSPDPLTNKRLGAIKVGRGSEQVAHEGLSKAQFKDRFMMTGKQRREMLRRPEAQ